MIHFSPLPEGHKQNDLLHNLTYRVAIPLFLLIFFLGPMHGYSQEEISEPDTGKTKQVHSYNKAALFSAVLPGLGQAYNRKYWKIPIIYAGIGVLTYFAVTNTQEFKLYKEAYIYTANGETYPTDNPYVGVYTEAQLQEGMDYYSRNRDLTYVIMGAWYIANILEAYVDAHFFYYDISDDLTLKVSPSVTPLPAAVGQTTPAIKITLKF